MTDLKEYFSGNKLYGNNFSNEQIKKWFRDEEEGYSSLIGSNHKYEFHKFNRFHGFSQIDKKKRFNTVLGFGAATGDELLPVIERIDKINIIEPSKKLRRGHLCWKTIEYISPKFNNKLATKSNTFDLITCFGVLHHIPNVSFVFGELSRVLKSGGYLLVREPIVSMGDWRFPRKGLTKRERGIPINIFRKIIKENNLQIISERKVMFPFIRRLEYLKIQPYNSKICVLLDYLFSLLLSWNNKYHSANIFQKLRPQSVFYVLKKN